MSRRLKNKDENEFFKSKFYYFKTGMKKIKKNQRQNFLQCKTAFTVNKRVRHIFWHIHTRMCKINVLRKCLVL